VGQTKYIHGQSDLCLRLFGCFSYTNITFNAARSGLRAEWFSRRIIIVTGRWSRVSILALPLASYVTVDMPLKDLAEPNLV
jgi:hypothetical protein